MYFWIVEYKDGSVVRQHQEDGTIVSSDIINRDLIKSFTLMNGSDQVIKMYIDDDKKFIYRRRVEKPSGGKETVCHLIGWRKRVSDQIIQSIVYVFEDGAIEFAGNFQDDHPWFYSPILRDFELS